MDDEVLDALDRVEDPILGDSIVSLGLVNSVEVEDGVARILLALGAPYSAHETQIADQVRDVLDGLGLEPDLTARIDRASGDHDDVLAGVKNVIAVASGKGGVGKSTVAVNLAVGLAEMGAQVGLFDADVYGPNVPRMFAADEGPTATGEETIAPPEKYGVALMSMDFLVGKDDPVIWRGPMVHNVITQLLETVEWGPLDYLVLDLPPGTGDTQLTVLQTIPLTGAVIVTTPQAVAVDDARKGLAMFARHDTPVLGIIENMSTFVCDECGTTHEVFGQGGGEAFADEVGMPFLGAIPLDASVRSGSDDGKPVVLTDSAAGVAFRSITENTANMVGAVRRRTHSDLATAKSQSAD